MILYHGTSEHIGRCALTEGLLPRRDHKQNTNWEHSIESNPDMIYLTQTYAGYFAANAVQIKSNDKNSTKEKWAIIEIDVTHREHRLYPDEDVLAQAAKEPSTKITGFETMSLIETTRFFRNHLTRYKSQWRNTLKLMGTVGYKGGLPPNAIKRVAIFDPKENPAIALQLTDPSITPLNHKLMNQKYEILTRWLMGENISAEDMVKAQTPAGMLDLKTKGVAELVKKQIAEWKKVINKGRSEILENNNGN